MGIESELAGISTPDIVNTAIGELMFRDGLPSPHTVELVSEYIDRARGVEVFLNAMPRAPVYALVKGPQALGVSRVGQVLLFDDDSRSRSSSTGPALHTSSPSHDPARPGRT